MTAWQRLAAAVCIGLALIALHGMVVRYDSYEGRFEPWFLIRQWLFQRYYKGHKLFLGASPFHAAHLASRHGLQQASFCQPVQGKLTYGEVSSSLSTRPSVRHARSGVCRRIPTLRSGRA